MRTECAGSPRKQTQVAEWGTKGMKCFVHALADVQSPHLGEGTRIWQFCVVLAAARLGRDCNINAQCLIENDVVLGDRVTVKPGVQLWDGMRVEDDVFIGPNGTFTNDKYPRSKKPPGVFTPTVLRRGASIGANATIVCGVEVGAYAMIGAGSVVTRNVPPGELWTGNPARSRGPAARRGRSRPQSHHVLRHGECGRSGFRRCRRLGLGHLRHRR